MKRLLQITIIVAFILSCAFLCDKHNDDMVTYDDLEIPPSLKGYELYSWEENELWNFTIITGTNRIKTYEEVTADEDITDEWIKITVSGHDSLKSILDKFPPLQTISWLGETWLENTWMDNYGNLMLPAQTIINEITMYCNNKNILLIISE